MAMEPKNANPPANIYPNKIHVTGFPHYTNAQDLKKVFSHYGNLTLEQLTHRFATLSFGKEDSAKAAVRDSMKIVLYGEFLTVKPFQQQRRSNPNSPRKNFVLKEKLGLRYTLPTTQDQVPGDVISPYRLDLSGAFDQQLSNILAAVRLTQEEVTVRYQLYFDLENVLQQQWPGCKAIPFGSITTGLGVKSSDADCYISIPREYHHPCVNYVIKAKRILLAYPDIFTDVIAIPRANTPIVKFFHLPTETYCDVTFKTPLGTRNSKLIAFLLHKDPRFIPLAVIIKYWAKVHGISGTGRLTNYALVWMMIFYLQTELVSLLPSVRWLQQNPAHDYMIDFWNAGFMHDYKEMPPCNNKSTVLQLIGGFFEFYAKFNFNQFIVCPYLGRPVAKEVFSNTNKLPKEFSRYKFNVEHDHAFSMRYDAPMCVQDPIEQSHNVASSVSAKMANDIRDYFKYAAAAYEQSIADSGAAFLKTILLTRPKIIRSKNPTEFKLILSTRELDAIEKPEWKNVIKDIVHIIFTEMLCVDLTNMEEKVTESQKQKRKYDATIDKAVWKRKQFSYLFGALDLGLVEKQKRISEEIIKADKHEFQLMVQVIQTFTDEPKKAVLSLKMTNGDANMFRELGKFFNGVILTWVKALLMPHLKPSVANAPVSVAEAIKNLDSNLDTNSDSDEPFPSPLPRKSTNPGTA